MVAALCPVQILLLRYVERHISDDCPLTVITVQVCHKDLPPHHTLVSAQVTDQVSVLQHRIDELIQKAVTLSRFSAFGPIEMSLVNFATAKRRNIVWRSSPFYSDLQGYKFLVAIAANGLYAAKNTHVSVAIHLMRSPCDGQLRWQGEFPFSCWIRLEPITLHMCLDFSHEVCSQACKRVPFWRDTASICLSKGFFISHSDLTPNYLVNDSLYFQVSKVELP